MAQNDEHLDLVAALLASGAMPLLGENHVNSYAVYGRETSSPEGRAATTAEAAIFLFTQIRSRLSQDVEGFHDQEKSHE